MKINPKEMEKMMKQMRHTFAKSVGKTTL